MRSHIRINKKNHLTIGGIDSVELVKKFGTPLYVLDEMRIRERYKEFRDAFKNYPQVEIKYAYKANSSLAVLNILKQEGAGADVLSAGEVYLATKINLNPDQIIFTGNNKTNAELELAVEKGIIINFDAIHELDRLEKICKANKKEARISFRVNPAISPQTHEHLSTGLKESKFGITATEALEAYKRAKKSKYLKISGIQMHIGSQITSSVPFELATSKLLDIVGALKEKLDLNLEFIDLGGGIGIRYNKEEPYITPQDLSKKLIPLIETKIEEYKLKRPILYFEPGRYILGDASILLAQVSTIKKTPYKKFIGVDAGFHVLIRPTLYNAYHEVIIANKAGKPNYEKVDIVGNVCESGDIFAKDRLLPKIEEGDIIALMDVGAYGIIMSSQYNSRPRPAEIIVKNGEYDLIRERENFQDLICKQHVPKRLK
jgi:diaminopimelate decarboxylase|tara:strand:- start:5007 stop:6299 length:1293 start_codon:yes stop_codon:yes gene_type:complete